MNRFKNRWTRKWYYIVLIPASCLVTYVVHNLITDTFIAFWTGIGTAIVIAVGAWITE